MKHWSITLSICPVVEPRRIVVVGPLLPSNGSIRSAQEHALDVTKVQLFSHGIAARSTSERNGCQVTTVDSCCAVGETWIVVAIPWHSENELQR